MKKEKRYISVSTKEEIIEKQNKRCAEENCGKDITIYADFDHKRPLSMGGKNIKSNIKAYCHECHAKKTRKDREKIKKWKEKKKKGKRKKKEKKQKIKNDFSLIIPKRPYKPPMVKF